MNAVVLATMTDAEIAANSIAALALFAAIIANGIAYRAGKKADDASSKALDAGKTANEIALRSAISTSSARISDCAVQISELLKGRTRDSLNEQEKHMLKVRIGTHRVAMEDYLNWYETASMRYLEGDVHQDKFKAEYRNEIQKICDINSKGFARRMHPEDSCKYRSIWKVRYEWFGPPR